MEELEITINEMGQVIVEVKGVKGSKCENLTRELEEKLGELIEKSYKTEYYQSNDTLKDIVKTKVEKS